MSGPVYRFAMRRVEVDRTGYYYPRWDRGKPLSIVATTEREAREKARALSPELHYPWIWDFRIDEITEVDSDAALRAAGAQ